MKSSVRWLAVFLLVLFFVFPYPYMSKAQAASDEIQWSEVKQGVYSPTHPNTLVWSDASKLMQYGGFDTAEGKVTQDVGEADFVMNQYGDFGARKIMSGTAFGKPVMKKDIDFEQSILGFIMSKKMQEGAVYFISGSEGTYMQIRIDRIVSASEVRFSYVTEKSAAAGGDDTPGLPGEDDENGVDYGEGKNNFTDVFWTKTKRGVYSPAVPYTLVWSDAKQLMQYGGFDAAGGKMTADGASADFVINQYGDFGARKLMEVQSFGKPIARKDVVFERTSLQDYTMAKKIKEGAVYIISGSGGKYVQIRIDQIVSASEIRFSYAVEIEKERPEKASDFNSLNKKYTRDISYVWSIVFNREVNEDTVTDETIYVKDSKGYLFETQLSVSYDGKKVFVTPIRNYDYGDSYTMYVTRNVKSANGGKALAKGSSAVFEVDLKGAHLDKTAPPQLPGIWAWDTGSDVYVSWFSSAANDTAGYRLYYRVKGAEKNFTKIGSRTTGDMHSSNEIKLYEVSGLAGKTVQFYVTAVDRSGNESIPSPLYDFTFTEETGNSSGDIGDGGSTGIIGNDESAGNQQTAPASNPYIGSWSLYIPGYLQSAGAPGGELDVFADGTYRWSGTIGNATVTGTWERRSYGYVLLNGESNADFLIHPHKRKEGYIALSAVAENVFTDGSPFFSFSREGVAK